MKTADEYISRCDEAINATPPRSSAQLKLLSDEIKAAFNPFIANISNYRGTNPPSTYTTQDIKKLRGKLAVYRDEKSHDLDIAKLNAAQRGATVIIGDIGNSNFTSNATANSSARVDASMSISQVFESVERDSSLTDEEKAELQSLLAEAKKTATSKDSGAFARIGAKIMEGAEKAAPRVVSDALGYLASLALKFLGA